MSYAASLRQQAAWVREALDPATPETQRITLDDIDVEELEAAANHIDEAMDLIERLLGLERGSTQQAWDFLEKHSPPKHAEGCPSGDFGPCDCT